MDSMKQFPFAAAVLAGTLCVAAGPVLGAEAAQVKVFDATQLTLDRYTVVKRIWTQSWRSAFWVPEEDKVEDAIAALTSKAADEGADAVINLHCLFDPGGLSSGYFCYGLAIKLK
ncbi:MAG TPA: hypothetical protein VLD15_05615 [Burkholderiales bacterium]|nr:hypothetical protein [Burkholderiales bacterium]